MMHMCVRHWLVKFVSHYPTCCFIWCPIHVTVYTTEALYGVETLRSRETVENIKWKCRSDWHTVCTVEALVRQNMIKCAPTIAAIHDHIISSCPMMLSDHAQ